VLFIADFQFPNGLRNYRSCSNFTYFESIFKDPNRLKSLARLWLYWRSELAGAYEVIWGHMYLLVVQNVNTHLTCVMPNFLLWDSRSSYTFPECFASHKIRTESCFCSCHGLKGRVELIIRSLHPQFVSGIHTCKLLFMEENGLALCRKVLLYNLLFIYHSSLKYLECRIADLLAWMKLLHAQFR
jgi:hypothetical protein